MVRFERFPYLFSIDNLQNWIMPVVVAVWNLLALVVLIFIPIAFIQNVRQLSNDILSQQFVIFIIPYLTGWVYLISGIYVFVFRKFDTAGQVFGIFSAACAIVLATTFDKFFNAQYNLLWVIMLAVAAGTLIQFALVFPARIRFVTRHPLFKWIGYALAILIAVSFWIIYSVEQFRTALVFWQAPAYVFGLAEIFFLILITWHWIKSTSPIVKEQAKLVFWGSVIAVVPFVSWMIFNAINPSLPFSPFVLFPLGFFPILTGYAIVRYSFIDIDYLISRSILYVILMALAVGSYALIVSGLSLVFDGLFQPDNPIILGLVVFIFAIGLNPVRNYFEKVVDQYFSREKHVYYDQQQEFVRELTQTLDISLIINLLGHYIEDNLSPERLHIYIFDSLAGQYSASSDRQGTKTSDIRFALDSPLVDVLSKRNEALFMVDFNDIPDEIKGEQARLALLAAQLFVPLPGRNQLIGWLAMGARRSAEPYSGRDLDFLEALCGQAALAVERTQVVSDLQRRMREMNVLTRVAQGVSFTVAFDDILELISAQTNQILPARDLHITLFDEEAETLYHAFYLEDDERLDERENRPLPIGRGLEAEIISSQTPLVTKDYEAECKQRGILPTESGIYAWMGVPLNAGAQTIGVISVGTRDPEVTYFFDQLSLLQAIADQASGAIVKARLLDESEQRARQLATINEIGIGLTSTLELKPLLNNIMVSASDILNCEAGSLFLVDQETGELVFEVVLGPVAKNLLGRRLAPGTGLVGEAVETGQPIIANDAKRRKEWHDKTDEQTGFDTQDLLVVPMRMQDRVIGVIEVINKRNGAPFTQQDQELLTAFTSQATIAIENARLYTMTDQALAERVEELSVMQRIDRELNASLDIERAMRITLDWAMRQSKADAGLVGEVFELGLRVMVSQGYRDEISEDEPSGNGNPDVLSFDIAGLEEAIESGETRYLALDDSQDDDNFGVLEGSRFEILVPIRRETVTKAVILLEAKQFQDSSNELLDFLTRLSDHAAIAMENAQLYEEVKEANLAKSQFVSFVAHELKNPMASIKGYTELISGEMAGPINDMQASFLSTVRSNVDRMNTIVSDLNDLTKIQVGNLRLDFQSIQIRDVLDEVIRSLNKQIEEKEQELIFEMPEDLPSVWADSSRMNQILTNLVSNAHKYTPEKGKIIIGARHETLDDQSMGQVEFLHLWVQDTGIGIEDEDQKSIFQQYFRTETAKEMASGTGLGLSITKSLTEMQGGSIWFESEAGRGTVFHITIPVSEMH